MEVFEAKVCLLEVLEALVIFMTDIDAVKKNMFNISVTMVLLF